MFSSLNSDLYFTDLYRPHNAKDRVRRPLTAMALHVSENLMGDLFVFWYISICLVKEMCAGSILHRLRMFKAS